MSVLNGAYARLSAEIDEQRYLDSLHKTASAGRRLAIGGTATVGGVGLFGAGHHTGREKGTREGHRIGYTAGTRRGYTAGARRGYTVGARRGFTAGARRGALAERMRLRRLIEKSKQERKRKTRRRRR